jgi:hypothetical protein
MMRAAIPDMPRTAKIPARTVSIEPKDYYVEVPISREMFINGTPKWIEVKTNRARRRAELHNSQTIFQRIFQPGKKYRTTAEVADLMMKANGIERPNFEILLSAPPEGSNQAGELSSRALCRSRKH